MKKIFCVKLVFCFSLLLILISCNRKSKTPTNETINSINLKRGDVISCGPPDKGPIAIGFGAVDFGTSCTGKTKEDFDLAIALLHSFEYEDAEKVFAKIIDEDPGCAMAYW